MQGFTKEEIQIPLFSYLALNQQITVHLVYPIFVRVAGNAHYNSEKYFIVEYT